MPNGLEISGSLVEKWKGFSGGEPPAFIDMMGVRYVPGRVCKPEQVEGELVQRCSVCGVACIAPASAYCQVCGAHVERGGHGED